MFVAFKNGTSLCHLNYSTVALSYTYLELMDCKTYNLAQTLAVRNNVRIICPVYKETFELYYDICLLHFKFCASKFEPHIFWIFTVQT